MRLVFQTQRLPRVIVIIILISLCVLNNFQLQPSLPRPPISHMLYLHFPDTLSASEVQ